MYSLKKLVNQWCADKLIVHPSIFYTRFEVHRWHGADPACTGLKAGKYREQIVSAAPGSNPCEHRGNMQMAR